LTLSRVKFYSWKNIRDRAIQNKLANRTRPTSQVFQTPALYYMYMSSDIMSHNCRISDSHANVITDSRLLACDSASTC